MMGVAKPAALPLSDEQHSEKFCQTGEAFPPACFGQSRSLPTILRRRPGWHERRLSAMNEETIRRIVGIS
jgi:hypothetical protein